MGHRLIAAPVFSTAGAVIGLVTGLIVDAIR